MDIYDTPHIVIHSLNIQSSQSVCLQLVWINCHQWCMNIKKRIEQKNENIKNSDANNICLRFSDCPVSTLFCILLFHAIIQLDAAYKFIH